MAKSPLTDSSGVLSFLITSDGSEISNEIEIRSIEVRKSFNRISRALLRVLDGDMPSATFPLSEKPVFKPGAKITIATGYDSTTETIFEGIVTRVGLVVDGASNSILEVECRDKIMAATVSRNSANFVDKTDSDIISSILSTYGVSATVDSTTATHKELVQFYCTDWDYVLTRAEVNGLLVSMDEGKVEVKAPDGSGSPVLTVTYGQDLIEFRSDLDARHQLKSVESVGWDPATLAIVSKTASPSALTGQGDLAAAALSDVLGVAKSHLVSSTSMEPEAIEAWAKSLQLKAELSRIRGRVKFQGSSLAKVGKVIELAGLGTRFNGNALICSVLHEIRDGNWTTEVGMGMAPAWFPEENNVTAPAASGLAGGVLGLQIGVVKKLDADPANQNRIQVSMPLMQAATDGVWARLSNLYATSAAGTFFLPEIGDEVVLGFFNDDPSHPVILGSLYSSKHAPPRTPDAQNPLKAIVSKSKVTIEFDDEKKVLTLVTPGKNTVVLSDDAKSILLKDQNGNKVELGDGGILLDSPKDIKLKATGNISLTATGKLELKATQDATMDGLNVNHTAQVGFVAKGNASAELSASGQTTVKGGLVMIN